MAKKSGSKSKTLFLGLIIVGLVFVYFLYHAITYITKEKVLLYELGNEVSLNSDETFTGLILREEKTVNPQDTGYINFYVEEGGRCGSTDIVYSIDEDGSFNNVLSSGSGISGLSAENLKGLAKDISKYTINYSGTDFKTVYNLKNQISYKLMGMLDIESEDSLKAMGINTNYFHTYKAEMPGIVEYYTDGFENASTDNINADSFNKKNYVYTPVENKSKIGKEDVAYKLITSDNWSVAIQLTDEQAEKYKNMSRVNVLFNETGIKTTVLFEEFEDSASNTYGLLSLSKYMVQYANSRYLSVTILDDGQKGIKVPVSAIAECEFYTVPLEYITMGGNTADEGLFIEKLSENGSEVTFVPLDIFYKDEVNGLAYISKSALEPGSLAVIPGGTDRAAISKTGILKGVYNVNKGYAVFKVIEIISGNDDFVLVKSNLKYSVNFFDNILLNAELGYEGMKIY